jgi:hypothetical protein
MVGLPSLLDSFLTAFFFLVGDGFLLLEHVSWQDWFFWDALLVSQGFERDHAFGCWAGALLWWW